MSRIVNNNGTQSIGYSNTYLTGLLLFGLLGFGALSIAGCDSSTPPAEPLAEVEPPLNNPPVKSPLSGTGISSLPSLPSSPGEEFPLTETKEQDGSINYSNITMTLYKVIDGNMKTEAINEEAFE